MSDGKFVAEFDACTVNSSFVLPDTEDVKPLLSYCASARSANPIAPLVVSIPAHE